MHVLHMNYGQRNHIDIDHHYNMDIDQLMFHHHNIHLHLDNKIIVQYNHNHIQLLEHIHSHKKKMDNPTLIHYNL